MGLEIRRVLIANRGEIAVRIARACRELGVESVAVYSEADALAPHVLAADRAEHIGPAPAAESYLSVPALIDAARRAGADAVHPGYGFLAENAAFAAACADAGLLFVGPRPEVIASMGSKIEARRRMLAAGVPVVPGELAHDQSDAGLEAAVRRVGLPALLKASAGGGGKGMRTVRADGEIVEALRAARREAVAAFGDGTLYVERYLERPRHVEFQIFGDHHGAVVHLYERDCSIQRRHQKIIEETPSTALTPALRARMAAAAVAAARAVGYTNAGTVEFLLEEDGQTTRFYFLEMNTRLQVEHPITELVTGVDLVRAQLLVAAGHPLPWRQEELAPRGHAIECRVYAEDPDEFLPQAGTVDVYREPAGPGIRIDSGVREGFEITVHYDPLLAKLIAFGETRAAALARAAEGLRRYAIVGIRTNVPLLLAVLDHPAFCAGRIHTGFLDAERETLARRPDADLSRLALAAAAACEPPPDPLRRGGQPAIDPWATLRTWRL